MAGLMTVLSPAGAEAEAVALGLLASLVAMGLLMVTGQLERIAYWMLETFPGLGAIG